MEILYTEQYETYIKMRVSVNWRHEVDEAEKWCIQHQCGKRVNSFSFSFKTKEEVTMFTLRWIK